MTTIFGHRGARGIYPENTLEGFLYATALGIEGLELDVVISKDKKVVVSHEPWMNPRTCTKPNNSKVSFLRRKNLYRMKYGFIREYDCGIRGNPDFPHQKKIPAYKPLLSEVIEKVEALLHSNNLPPVTYLIEIKSKHRTDELLHPPPEEFAELVVNELLRYNINNRVIIQSFDMRPLNSIHAMNKGFKLGMLVRNPRLIRARRRILNFTPDTCGAFYQLVNERWLKRIHDWGMKAYVWTENEKRDMRRHLAMGIDGIISDYPGKVLEVRKEMKK